MPYATVKLEFELAGVGGGWTDKSTDFVGDAVVSYGTKERSPVARTAGSGSFNFQLDNSSGNSAGRQGLYSPGRSATVLSGFAIDMRVRLTLTDPATGTPQVRFVGSVSKITTEGGKYGRQRTTVNCLDWIDDAARNILTTVPIQINATGGTIINAIIAACARQPFSTSIATGRDTFPYALDSANASTPSNALAEINRVTMSELGYAYVKGTGQFTWEQRFSRAVLTSSATFSDTMSGLDTSITRDLLVSQVRASANPRFADTSVIVLWTLGSVLRLDAGTSATVNGPFTDPTQRAISIGAWALSTLTATTDYLANSAADGSGTNLTSSLTITPTPSGNAVSYVITNGASVPAYVTFLQQRGKGLYNYKKATFAATNATTATNHGSRTIDLDMTYQSDASVAQATANYLMALYSASNAYTASSVSLMPGTAALQTQILTREIGDMITIVETVTGMSTNFYINAIDMTIKSGGIVSATWTLALADAGTYWSIGVAGASEIGLTTVLAY